MRYWVRIIRVTCILLIISAPAFGERLEDKIRAAESDIKVFCPAMTPDQIQWSALLYLNQQYGAEIFVALFHPSAYFGYKEISTGNNQFHLAYIGYPDGFGDSLLIDSVSSRLFGGGYPDIAIFDAVSKTEDSISLAFLLNNFRYTAQNDSLALSKLEHIFVRGERSQSANVIFNDAEIYKKYSSAVQEIHQALGQDGPQAYYPERFRWYYKIGGDTAQLGSSSDFLPGMDNFRLPEIIANHVFQGPERKNLLDRLNRFRSYIRSSYNIKMGRPERLRLLLMAYGEISRLVQLLESGTGNLANTRVPYQAKLIRYKTSLAVADAVGINWTGKLQTRQTPFGSTGKLFFDLELTGSLEIELSYFKYHPTGQIPVIIDSISTIVTPHQKLHREYPIDLGQIDFSNQTNKSQLFSIEVILEGIPMDLYVSYVEYADAQIALTWLPGYAILSTFSEGSITSLAQPFDWQIQITKPFQTELNARLIIDNSDAIVVGSYEKNITIPAGVTTKYIDIYLAAGRSIGQGSRTITASLVSDGQVIAATSANVRIILCDVPETRDIAYVPDSSGKLEDFLRMINVSYHPFTPHSVRRASMEAYDMLIIGSNPAEYLDALRASSGRLRRFVQDGGDILILGQDFGWPHNIFDFPIYTSQNIGHVPAQFKIKNHRILTWPYKINISKFASGINESSLAWSAIFNSGDEVISAGERGSYIRLTKIGDGHLIFCGLPLLDMAAELDLEAIHLLANLLNYGHGN